MSEMYSFLNLKMERLHDEFFYFEGNAIFYLKNKAIEVKSIIVEKEYFLDVFKEKDEIFKYFECSILFYRDVINKKLGREVFYYEDYIDVIDIVCEKNNMVKLLDKIDILMRKQKLVRNNLNINMLIDSLLVDMEV